MSLLSTMFIAFGVSMDAFAVSIANGANKKFNRIIISAVLFGVFQAVQPVFGWFLGVNLRDHIIEYDHWIASSLLFFIGIKMIYDAIFVCEDERKFICSMKYILLLAFATSVDALIIGLSFSILDLSILLPALFIGMITFVMSFAGCRIGRKFGKIMGSKFEVAGGVILCLMGINILIKHLL
jgi:manganese efflux pump family protein